MQYFCKQHYSDTHSDHRHNRIGPTPLNPSICSGQSASFTVTGGGQNLSYQWQENGSNIVGSGTQSIYSGYYSNSGASSSTLLISNVSGLNNYSYDCVVTGSCGSPNTSGTATLTVIPAPSFSSAGASIYSSTWTLGQNDDKTNGFGAWNLTTSGGTGTFFTDGYATNILTNGRAWGIYDNGGQANAIRPITTGLSVGNTLNFSMENGTIQLGGTVGFNLQNSSGQNLMQFYFVGGQTNYTLNDGTATLNTSIGFTSTGLNIAIAYTAANTYSIAITSIGGSTSYFTGRSFISQSNEVPGQIVFFNYNGSATNQGGSANSYFNSLAINNPDINGSAYAHADCMSEYFSDDFISYSL